MRRQIHARSRCRHRPAPRAAAGVICAVRRAGARLRERHHADADADAGDCAAHRVASAIAASSVARTSLFSTFPTRERGMSGSRLSR